MHLWNLLSSFNPGIQEIQNGPIFTKFHPFINNVMSSDKSSQIDALGLALRATLRKSKIKFQFGWMQKKQIYGHDCQSNHIISK